MIARTPGGHRITDVLAYSHGSACVQAVTSSGIVIFWVPMQNITVTNS